MDQVESEKICTGFMPTKNLDNDYKQNKNKTTRIITIKYLSIAELPSLLRTNELVSKRVGPGNQRKGIIHTVKYECVTSATDNIAFEERMSKF